MTSVLVRPRSAKIAADLPVSPPSPPSPPGSPSALVARLYREERAFVRRVVVGRGVPARDREDVVHDVFLVVQRRIDDLDPSCSPRPWLYVIAVQVAFNYLKLARHRREEMPDASPDVPCVSPGAEERLSACEEALALRRRIARLRPKLRMVVVAHVLEEQPMPEVAAALEIPEKTGYARLRLARAALTPRRGASASATASAAAAAAATATASVSVAATASASVAVSVSVSV